MRKSFTLMELMIVLIVVGILAAIGIPVYRKAVLSAEGRGAVANLRAIEAAEKVEFLERDLFTACGNTAACNNLLRLDISDTNYNYFVNVAAPNFTARAVRTAVGDVCTYTVTNTVPLSGSAGCVYEQ